MSVHEVKLKGHLAVAEGTMAFRLSKPDGFVFKGGQFIELELIGRPAEDRSPQRLFLAYSNRRPEDAAFLDELQQLERRNTQFHLMATMTDMGKSAREWRGETGIIDADMLKRCVGNAAAPVYYVVGPPAMVKAMQGTLAAAGIAEDNIRTEEFLGY